jgi:hypothetical protein
VHFRIPRPLTKTALAMPLAAITVSLLAVGCTEPQSAVVAKKWCLPPDGDTTAVLDDMEDGDDNSCANRTDGVVGTWNVRSNGLASPIEYPSGNKVVTLVDDPYDHRSTRAVHFKGAGVGPATMMPAPAVSDVWAGVGIKMNTPFALTSPSPLLKFYARVVGDADGGMAEPLRIRVNLIAGATPDCDSGPDVPCANHLGAVVPINATWTQYNVAVFALEDMAKPADGAVSEISEIQFRFAQSYGETARQAANPPAFDIWIDDIQLTP